IRRVVPGAQLRGDRHLQPAVAGLRRAGQRHVRVRPARLHLGLPHRLGEADLGPTGCPYPPLQSRRADAAAARNLSDLPRSKSMAKSKSKSAGKQKADRKQAKAAGMPAAATTKPANGKLKKKDYEALLEPMQVELNQLHRWLQHTGKRL